MRRITKDALYSRNRRKKLCGRRGFCSTCFLQKAVNGKRSCMKCLVWDRKRARRRVLEIKNEVLSHYGKGKNLLCRAKGCLVSNIYMLTLDHIDGGGSLERKETGRLGWMFYTWLKKQNFPSGFQTLCMNHQFLKEAMRRKKGWL